MSDQKLSLQDLNYGEDCFDTCHSYYCLSFIVLSINLCVGMGEF